jgi:GTP cyclohydrolase IB
MALELTDAQVAWDSVTPSTLEDIQSQPDERQLPIDQVGITGLRYPIVVLDRSRVCQNTVATLTLAVSLPHHFKGTHMSRFIEVLEHHRGEVTVRTLPALLGDLKRRLEAERARVEVCFPYALVRVAPVSGARAVQTYDCWFIAEANGAHDDFVLGVEVPVTSLCPCSKAISVAGAHTQRGELRLETRGRREEGAGFALIWIEELIEVAERAASAPVYPLLKRPDVRHLTMQAYDHPVFVEDMVRNAALELQKDPRVAWFRVRAENHESIHNHNAFAELTWPRAAERMGDDA